MLFSSAVHRRSERKTVTTTLGEEDKMAEYGREKQGRRLLPGSINTYKPLDLLDENEFAFLQNVRAYLQGRYVGRAPSSNALYTLAGPPYSIRRLNDSTGAGPVAGYVRIIGAAGEMYVNATSVATGLTGNPVSIDPFRPNASVQAWAYIGDSSPSPDVTIVADSFNCSGAIKIRSDGLTRKTGVKEPQAAPTSTFPGGGTGPTLIYYYYTYRASETGATSNPSPVSIPGTNSQSSPAETQVAASGGVINPDITVNASQYEGNGTQIRTKAGVAPGTVTDYVIAQNFGFSLPTNVTVTGIQVDLNWVGQNAGTGVLSGVALYYLGGPLGNAKFPGIQNQSFATDTLQGGNADTWGAALSPTIVNDSTFGFGVQITTQSVGGSDRSFLDTFTVTVYYSTQDANVSATPSTDPQVDKIDFYRQGGGLANPTYVGTGDNSSAVFNDQLSDLAAAQNPELEFDNFEPFPAIDLPQEGILNASGQVLTWVSGGSVPSGSTGFNIRWLPGTVVLIGSPEQVAYSAVRRPTNNTTWDFTNNDVNVPSIPDGTNLPYSIAEPTLAQQPLQSMWGPTDNSAYMFACYDPINPGTLYYTKGNNPDSAPDTNQISVSSPSEPLMNGCIVNGIGMVFSTEKAWLIYPTFTTALATVSGVEGQAFSLVESIANRGLYIRSCICTEAGQNVFFRAKDGIYISPGGAGSQSLTDAQIYNLFPHEGMVPQPVVIGPYTVYPPDDTQPESQRLSFATGYLYFDYVDSSSAPHTLVYDVAAKGWSVDVGNPTFTVHALEEGPNVNDTIVGCSDGTVRTLSNTGTEVVTSVVATGSVNSGDARAFKRIGDVFIKALVTASNPITLAMYANRYQTLLSGFSPTSLAGTGNLLPYVVDFTSGFAQDVIDIASVFSWNTSSGNRIELWQPTWIDLPATVQDQPTDWVDLGSAGSNYVRGLILEADTFNVAKAIAIEDELGNLQVPQESPITLNGQQKIGMSFNPPFVSHIGRIVSTDGVPWRRGPEMGWSLEWISDPYPEITRAWTPIMEINGPDNKFVQGIKIIADSANSPVTFQILFDGGQTGPTFTGTFNGKQTLVFSWTPFLAHDLQLVPQQSARIWYGGVGDGISAWQFQPFPESLELWQTELTDLGGQGWQHVEYINFEYISTAAVTLAFTVDSGNGSIAPATLTIPSSGGTQTKFKSRVTANKWKLLGFMATSSAKMTIFQEGFEVWTRSWCVGGPLTRVRPFGGPSDSGAAV
jgi:hypothetical protein